MPLRIELSKILIVAVLTTLLASCGGGGGDSSIQTGDLAQTVNVDVRGTIYSVETVRGTGWNGFNVLSRMAWWGDAELAREFSEAVGLQLGFTNNGVADVAKPLFARTYRSNERRMLSEQYKIDFFGDVYVGGIQIDMGASADYAIATVAPLPDITLPMIKNVVTVEVRGTLYSVELLNVSGNDGYTYFTQMPWWGDAALAREFSEAVGFELGFSNNGFAYEAKPLFARTYRSNERRMLSQQYEIDLLGDVYVDSIEIGMTSRAPYAFATVIE